jgi:AcrR family transcriptional regulator
MDEKKTDRRVRYTQMVIRQSFVKLLMQKPISKITIKEICDDADVNRATFYAHYSDQYDLLRQIENGIINDITQYLSAYDLTNISNVPAQMLNKILEYIKENAEIFELLLLSYNADIQFQQEITKIIGQQHFSALAADKEDSEYVFLFFANGAIGIIVKWLKDGMKKPIAEITELILKLSIHGRSYFEQNA